MDEKCKRVAGGAIKPCVDMQQAICLEGVVRQHMRNQDTGKMRERFALVKKKTSMQLLYCPWCRADIDTRPRQRAPATKAAP